MQNEANEAVEELNFDEFMSLSEDQQLRKYPLWTAVMTERGDDFALALAQETAEKWIDVDEPMEINDEHNVTPFNVSTVKRQPQFLKFLLAQGANINAMTSEGSVPLTLSIKTERLNISRLLMDEGADPDPLENGQGTLSPLAMAATHGLNEVVKDLIDLGVNVRWINSEGEDALKLASVQGEMECVESLLNAGADPALVDNYGFSAIHCAVDRHYHGIVMKLLDAGVDVDFRINSPTVSVDAGTTPLHRASAQLDLVMVKTLVERGADVNAITEDSSTPLSYVYDFGDEEDDAELIQYLINHGANPDF